MKLRVLCLFIVATLVVAVSVNVTISAQSQGDGRGQRFAIGGGPQLTRAEGHTTTGGLLKLRYEGRFKLNNSVEFNRQQLENTATVAIPLFKHGEVLTLLRYGVEKRSGRTEENLYLGAGFQSPWDFKFMDRRGELESYIFATGRSFDAPGKAWLAGGGLEAYMPIADRLMVNAGVEFTRKNGLPHLIHIHRNQVKGFAGILFIFGKRD